MKLASILGYAFGFLFIAVCALVTAQMNRERKTPGTPQQATPPLGAPMGARPGMLSWSPEEAFHSRDEDGDGRLSAAEYASGWASSSPERSDFTRRMFDGTDADGDGYLTMEESRAFWDRVRQSTELAQRQFDAMDADDDGRVSRAEAAGNEATFDDLDLDADGYVEGRELRLSVFRLMLPRDP